MVVVLPIIPMTLAGVLAASLYGLTWYGLLSPAERRSVDRRYEELALKWFGKEPPDLDEDEAKAIIDELKSDNEQ